MELVVGGPLRVGAGDVVQLDEFLRFVLPYAPGCSDITATNAIRSAVIQLCNQTNIWEEEVGPLDVEKDEAKYDLLVPPDSTARQLTWVAFNGRQMEIKPLHWIRQRYGSVRIWSQEVGEPHWVTVVDKYALTLVPKPEKDYPESLYYNVACSPTQSAKTVPEQLIDYAPQIGAGALSLILIEPQRSYSNPALADSMGKVFAAQVSDIRVRKNQSFTNAPLQVQMRKL